MARRKTSSSKTGSSVIDGALAALEADDLRELVRDLIPWLDEHTRARFVNEAIDRAARSESGWTPATPSDERVSEIVAFAEAAERTGYADRSEVDDYLLQGSNSFRGKDYRAAFRIFRALLLPIGDGGVDLGQHEMIDEVLGVDTSDCAAQYVVAVYMTAVPARRAEAVRAALDDVHGVGCFWEPLREMERVAVELLPGFDEFLSLWRALVEKEAGRERRSDWDTDENQWLREVVQRMEGAEGLARVARSTRRADDLRAWCRMLVEARDWKSALSAYEEAAEIVTERKFSRGDFLDGVALAAQELARKDLPARLERAWREAPSMLRLRRWLGSSGSKAVVRNRAGEALEACPKKAHRQRALLHVVLRELEPAAKLLASAPGLGWSDSEHPGHLLFPLFHGLLGGKDSEVRGPTERFLDREMDLDELEWAMSERDEPRLVSPEVDEIRKLAGLARPKSDKTRAAVLKAMRKAAEKRIAGVTKNKRRRYYGHAASLAAACVAVAPTPETTAWMANIRDEYRRYPALQRELARHQD